MSQATGQPDLWTLIRGAPWIDPHAMLNALQVQLREPLRDFRTRLLVRDAIQALERYWSPERVRASIASDVREEAFQIRAEDLGAAGFPLLEQRMAVATDPTTITSFFRDLGRSVPSPARLDVGGSSALILRGLLTRGTDDIDAVDEVPAVLRTQYDLLERLGSRYRLQLAHFQSHYLPEGWKARVQSLGRFDKLDVYLVDAVDIFVGKLFSKREKDFDDLRTLLPALSADAIRRRMHSAAARLLSDPILRPLADKNWYVLFGEPLPT